MEQTQNGRTRTFSWSDPMVNAEHIGRRSGLEMLRAVVAGELPAPPVMQMLGIDDFVAEEGRITVRMTAQEFHYNPLGSVHGGVLATLLDTAAGCAVHSVLPAGVGYTSLDLLTKFFRPVTLASGQLVCHGRVLSRGRRTAHAEAQLFDGRERLVAQATSTCLLMELPAVARPA